MLESIAGSGSFLVPNLLRMQNDGGKLSVPVDPYVTRFIQFKHIVGIPTGGSNAGVPVSRLVAIDNLIDILVGNENAAPTPKESSLGNFISAWA